MQTVCRVALTFVLITHTYISHIVRSNRSLHVVCVGAVLSAKSAVSIPPIWVRIYFAYARSKFGGGNPFNFDRPLGQKTQRHGQLDTR